MSNKVYKIITEKIIEKLEKGVLPWKKTWECGMPQNFVSKKSYHGINVLLLAGSEHSSPNWLTFNQVSKLGGSVKKGAKSMPVVFWKLNKYEREKTMPDGSTKIEEKSFPMLRYYRVFNIEDTTLEVPKVKFTKKQSIKECEKVLKGYKNRPGLINAMKASYTVITDKVKMPKMERFDKAENYYSTLFHEFNHSTGHKKRLDRDMSGSFGNVKYAKEELIAELGASFLCAITHIETKTLDNAASYIKSWLKALKDDEKFIFNASSKAQKSVDYILGVK